MTGYVRQSESVIAVYLDRDGEPCDETTVAYSALKTGSATEH
ncbi:hypothetical protein LCGC14_2639000 [marine sediment metagenome]|uniref:Uncharacterized protein n=1 Tax=marine sediment metagenome TaxID=412755 RepID=A0A0F9AKJ4_9ZZZZ